MWASTRIMRVCGSLLLAAAALKAWGLGLDPVGRMGFFSTPEAQLTIIEFEVLAGIWMWSGKSPIGAWFIGLATFLTFSGVSLYLGLIGQSSCGCAGRMVSVSPWVALGVDVTILALLWVARPSLKTLREITRGDLAAAAVPIGCGVGGIVALSAIVLGLAYAEWGSVPAAIAYFRGERVSTQRFVEVGDGTRGENRKVMVEVANWTDQPVRLIGGTADCSCTVLDDLPVTIPPHQTCSVSVDVALTGKPGIYTRRAGFLVDDGGLLVVPQQAFASGFADCPGACCLSCNDTVCTPPSDCNNACTANCMSCISACNLDQSCIDACVVAAGIKCPGNTCDNTTNKNTMCTLRDWAGGGCSGGAYTCSQAQDKCMNCMCVPDDNAKKCACK